MSTENGSNAPVTYWDYIRVEELLGLQGGLPKDEAELENEEVLFITVHQIFELWFKLILRELRSARDLFRGESVDEQSLSGAVAGLKRVSTVLGLCARHFELMETLNTREYLAFRDKLTPASGFQSAQMRQIEILLGLDEGERIGLGSSSSYKDVLRDARGKASPALERVEAQLADRPTLKAAVEDWLYRTPIDGVLPDEDPKGEALDRFVAAYTDAHGDEVDLACEAALQHATTDEDGARLRERFAAEKGQIEAFLNPENGVQGLRRRRLRAAALFIVTYRELPLLAWPREVLDLCIEVEQRFLVFRQRHARMVERVIGRRTGTGGSSGVEYLDQTALSYRVFKDLWAVRTFQIRKEAAPALQNPEFYGFRYG